DPFAVLAELVVDESVAVDWYVALLHPAGTDLPAEVLGREWEGFLPGGLGVEELFPDVVAGWSAGYDGGPGPGGSGGLGGFDWDEVQAQLGLAPGTPRLPGDSGRLPSGPAADAGGVAGPSRRARKRKQREELSAPLHAPRPASDKRGRTHALDILSAVQHAPQDRPALKDIARALSITAKTLRRRLLAMRGDLGLENGDPDQIFDYISEHLDRIVRSAYGYPAAALEPVPTPFPVVLADYDRQLIGTALTHPHATITELARHYNRLTQSLDHAYALLGTHLNASGKGTEVLAYIRGHQDEILRLAGLDLNCLPEIPHHTATLNDDDRQLIGTALTHPHATITELARHYNRLTQSLHEAYALLGTHLNAPGKGTEVLAYIRGHQDEALLFAGLDRHSLPEIPHHTTALNDDDRQLIGTALTYPRATITALARHYNRPRQSLYVAYARLGTHLNASGKGTEVLAYIRGHQDEILRLAGLDLNCLPEIPHHTATLNDDDRQLIGTALTHPHATITELAHQYNRPTASLQRAYGRLGPRLNAPGTAAQVLTYIRGHQDEVLLTAGLDCGSLPEINLR
ncbi:hypothetical protein, partial [Streptomyces chartreusis]|uniref:hypothetical protein n=1 Tax=Streptomyces chartreusis TaxID=1969 RepID=UPI003474839F